ncbi:MAG: hypothetical protein JW827_12505 [Spirochaetes bacterium]|nr:hypothetical protein [Spirochaetota bacterium]
MDRLLITLDRFDIIQKRQFLSEQYLSPNSEFFIFLQDKNKVYGLFQIKKTYALNGKWKIIFAFAKKYRRGIDASVLKSYNIRINGKRNLNQKQSETLIKILGHINFPRLSPDLLLVEGKESRLDIKYFRTWPSLSLLNESLYVNHKILKGIVQDVIAEIYIFFEKLMKKEGVSLLSLQQTAEKLFSFLKRSEVFGVLEKNDLCLITKGRYHYIPFEILFDGTCFLAEKVNISRLLFSGDIPAESEESTSGDQKEVYIIIPPYKKSLIDSDKIYQLFSSRPGKINLINKALNAAEFCRICENSAILYFAGHAKFNSLKKEYGLKLGGKHTFYLGDFRHCVRLPRLIFFQCCFENRFFSYTEKFLSQLFCWGVKNIVMPFMEIPLSSYGFLEQVVKHILSGRRIGEAFRLAIFEKKDNYHYDWIFYRLYGDPRTRYFQRS